MIQTWNKYSLLHLVQPKWSLSSKDYFYNFIYLHLIYLIFLKKLELTVEEDSQDFNLNKCQKWIQLRQTDLQNNVRPQSKRGLKFDLQVF